MDESNKILSNPAISPRAIRYHLLTMSLALLCTVAGVVLIPLMLPIISHAGAAPAGDMMGRMSVIGSTPATVQSSANGIVS